MLIKSLRKLLFLGVFFLVFTNPVQAASLSLEPVNKSLAAEESFTVQLKIDTQDEVVTSADIVLTYNPGILEVQRIVDGNGQQQFFSEVFKRLRGSEIYIGAAVKTRADAKKGQGLIASITFKGKQAGQSGLNFDCAPRTSSDSNISKNDQFATDILDCSQLTNGSYLVLGSGGPTTVLTPTPTSLTLPTATPVTTTSTPSPTTTPGGPSLSSAPTIIPGGVSLTPTPPGSGRGNPPPTNRKLPNVGITQPTQAVLVLGILVILAGALILRV